MRKLLLLLGFSICFLYLVPVLGAPDEFFPGLLYLFAPLMALVFGIRAMYVFGIKSEAAKPLVFITVGLGLLFLGEVTWWLLEFVFNSDPFPSIADGLFLGAYPFLLIGFLVKVYQEGLHNKQVSWFKSIGLIFFGSYVSVGIVYLGVYSIYVNYLPFWDVFFSTLYGVMDVILTMVAVMAFFISAQYKGGTLYQVWFRLAVGLALFLAADVLFLLYNQQYQDGLELFRLIDLVWVAAYVCLAQGLSEVSVVVKKFKSTLEKTQKKMERKKLS